MSDDNNTSKPNSQVLRDKLNNSLKLRFGRKADSEAASHKTLPDAHATQESPPLVLSTANSSQKPRQSNASANEALSKQFLTDIEADAKREVDLIDSLPLFTSQLKPAPSDPSYKRSEAALSKVKNKALKPTQKSALPEAVPASQDGAATEPKPKTLVQPRPSARDIETSSKALHPIPSEDRGSPTMQEEDSKTQEPPSLLDLLKSGKQEPKALSSLKAPRQSALNLHNAQNEQNAEISAVEDEPASQVSKKDAFLKAPRNSRSHAAATKPTPLHASSDGPVIANADLTHEQEIFMAIRNGDPAWIEANAKFTDINENRQEIIMIFSLSQPECLQALFNAGLKFNTKDGLALRTAIGKKHYHALEIIKTMGARLDLDTLKAVGAWRRAQQKQTANEDSPASFPQEPSLPSKLNAQKIQEDFDQFLVEHATEISREDLSAFSASTVSAAHEAEPASMVDKPPFAPAVAEPIPSHDKPLTNPISDQPEFLDFDQLSAPSSIQDPPSPTPSSSVDLSLPDDKLVEDSSSPVHVILSDTLPLSSGELDLSAGPVGEPPDLSHPSSLSSLPHALVEGAPNELAMEPPVSPHPALSTFHPSPERKPVSGGPSAIERARLAMFDKLVIEKQQLEARVLELQMYADAAASLEDERDRLIDDLSVTQEFCDQLQADLTASQERFTQFDSTKSELETQLAQARASVESAHDGHRLERERFVQASTNTSGLLKDSERRETELRARNAELSIKIAELESREAPPPEAHDWLAGTDREAHLRKHMFVEAVIKGEFKLLDKISKNTAVESELAHHALVFASEFGQVKCAQWLVDNMGVHPGFGEEIALLRALNSGQLEMVRWLARNGSDIHYAEEFALRLAVDKDDVSLLDFVVGLGANPRAANERALREAASKQSWLCFKALLGYGCSGYDPTGAMHKEISAQEEAKERIEWIAAQRKLAKTLDPEFLKRQKRIEL